MLFKIMKKKTTWFKQSATTGDRQSNKQKKSSSKLQISYTYNEGYVNAVDLTIGTLTLPQGKENFFFLITMVSSFNSWIILND